MKKMSLVLMMVLGLASFAQAEECIPIESAVMSLSGNCKGDAKEGDRFFSVSALCRKKLGRDGKVKNSTCRENVGGSGNMFEKCVKSPLKVEGWNVKVAKGGPIPISCHGGGMDQDVRQSIENSWKTGACFAKDAAGKCTSGGTEKKNGCEVAGKIETEYFYDFQCKVGPKTARNDYGKNVVGDSSEQSDLKEKKLTQEQPVRAPDPDGLMMKKATIPMESVKSKGAK